MRGVLSLAVLALLIAPILAAAAACAGCGPPGSYVAAVWVGPTLGHGLASLEPVATSPFMRPSCTAKEPLAAPSPGKALVVFVRPTDRARSFKWTIIDGNGHWLGDSLARTHFAVELPPGADLLIALGANTAAVDAELLADGVYYVEVAPMLRRLSPPPDVTLVAVRPGTRAWHQVGTWLTETTRLVADRAAGQAWLDQAPEVVDGRIGRAHELIWKFTPDQRAEHTLEPNDGHEALLAH
jgi:hypothetical protein